MHNQWLKTDIKSCSNIFMFKIGLNQAKIKLLLTEESTNFTTNNN